MSTAAARMRKYRARRRLKRVLGEAHAAGVNVDITYHEWRRDLTERNAAPRDEHTRTLDLGPDACDPPRGCK